MKKRYVLILTVLIGLITYVTITYRQELVLQVKEIEKIVEKAVVADMEVHEESASKLRFNEGLNKSVSIELNDYGFYYNALMQYVSQRISVDLSNEWPNYYNPTQKYNSPYIFINELYYCGLGSDLDCNVWIYIAIKGQYILRIEIFNINESINIDNLKLFTQQVNESLYKK